MTVVEVTGAAVPHFSRQGIGSFVRKILRALDDVRSVERRRPRRPRRAAALHRERVGDVSIALVDDRTMRNLNRKFRRKNETTDVLTFPDEESCEIVISVDQAHRQAQREKHSLGAELRYLILHGILHALGYDHQTDRGEMNALELRVRERVGLD